MIERRLYHRNIFGIEYVPRIPLVDSIKLGNMTEESGTVSSGARCGDSKNIILDSMFTGRAMLTVQKYWNKHQIYLMRI